MSQSPEAPPPPGGKPKFLDPAAAAADTYDHQQLTITSDEAPVLRPEDFMETDPHLSKPLSPRHKQFVHMIAMGTPPAAVAKELKYSMQRVYQLLKDTRMKTEIARIQDRMFQSDIITRLKDLGGDAVDVLEELMRDPAISALKKADKATWIIEKLSGKAKQEVAVEATSIAAFMEVMRQMQQSGERIVSSPDIDVTPRNVGEGAEPQANSARPALPAAKSNGRFTKWVDEEL